ncbi:hypothetical protein D3C73_976870 [compost metagenome]
MRQHGLARRGAQGLARVIADHAGVGPFQVQLALQQLLDERQPLQGFGIRGGLGRPLDLAGLFLQRVQLAGQGGLEQAVHRVGGIAGPVAVEVPRYIIDRRADRQHIQVGEQHAAACPKVLIADIAATDDGGLVVGGE